MTGGIPGGPKVRGAAGCRAAVRRALAVLVALLVAAPAVAQPTCRGTVFLTIDTGWSREAEEIAAILRRRNVRATLFVADEPTHRGDRTLGPEWAPFWRARAAEGHVFASHTWRHWYFSGDAGPNRVRYASRGGAGSETLDGAAMCAELRRPVDAIRAMVPGATILPLWRAPGGRTTPNALALGRACGMTHVGWTASGFLGDELDSGTNTNAALLSRNLANVRAGEVMVMHWGVRSRREPFAGILEPLIAGLQERGLCFATLPPTGP